MASLTGFLVRVVRFGNKFTKGVDMLTLPLRTPTVPLSGVNMLMVVYRGKTIFAQTTNGSGSVEFL